MTIEASNFIKKIGLKYAQHVLSDEAPIVIDLDYAELGKLVASWELIEKLGGLSVVQEKIISLKSMKLETQAQQLIDAVANVKTCL